MSIKIFVFIFSLLLIIKAQNTTYYVDAAVSASGDGLSWATALKTITEAANKNLQPGDLVYIKPGIYNETLNLKKSGSITIPVTSGITLTNVNRINFPSGTDLSSIDLTNNPNQYYACVYRSYYSNNGYFKVISVNDAADYIEVENGGFINESGVSGNFDYLSCAVIRPIIFKKYSSNPITERVEVSLATLPSAYTALYVGTYINEYDATPCNYLIVDGIDLKSSQNGGGIHIQDSKHVIIANSKVYDMKSTGIYINGNSTDPANYNMIINNEIYNTPYEGIYIGAGGQPATRNWTNYNHIIGNTIYTSGTSTNAKLENAIEVKEYNVGNVIESNLIRDFKLETSGNGAINLKYLSKKTLVYNNIIKNITKATSNTGTNYILNIEEKTEYSYIFNNLIYNPSAYSDNVYALSVFGENTVSNGIYNNTFYNIRRGILLQYYKTGGNGSDINVSIKNNIFSNINSNLIEEWTNGSGEGHFTLSNNLFNSNPNNSYYPVTSDFIGNPNFLDVANENFDLSASSLKAIDKGVALSDISLAYDLNFDPRLGLPDLGAYEYSDPVPVELISFSAKKNNNSIILNWQTATELNNYGFEIENNLRNNKSGVKSEDWKVLGFVKGAGNSNSPKNYTFIDENPPFGIVQYRLKQIDNDGSFKYSDVIEVNNNESTDFELYQNYPNPFNPSTAIKFSLNKESKVKILIYDINGAIVNELINDIKEAGTHIVYWNSNNNKGQKVASGVYYYKMWIDDSENELKPIEFIRKMILIK